MATTEENNKMELVLAALNIVQKNQIKCVDGGPDQPPRATDVVHGKHDLASYFLNLVDSGEGTDSRKWIDSLKELTLQPGQRRYPYLEDLAKPLVFKSLPLPRNLLRLELYKCNIKSLQLPSNLLLLDLYCCNIGDIDSFGFDDTQTSFSLPDTLEEINVQHCNLPAKLRLPASIRTVLLSTVWNLKTLRCDAKHGNGDYTLNSLHDLRTLSLVSAAKLVVEDLTSLDELTLPRCKDICLGCPLGCLDFDSDSEGEGPVRITTPDGMNAVPRHLLGYLQDQRAVQVILQKNGRWKYEYENFFVEYDSDENEIPIPDPIADFISDEEFSDAGDQGDGLDDHNDEFDDHIDESDDDDSVTFPWEIVDHELGAPGFTPRNCLPSSEHIRRASHQRPSGNVLSLLTAFWCLGNKSQR